jgi:mannosyltransferase OCH1-like enzyme
LDEDVRVEVYDSQVQEDFRKIAHQTYHDLSLIPQKVEENWKKYAPEFERRLYDDEKALRFINQHFSSNVAKRFMSLRKGAHKADLFRYCVLYIHGGLYADIKTEFIRPIREVIREKESIYICKSMIKKWGNDTCYNGFIYSPPKQPIFLSLIQQVLSSPDWVVYFDYLIFCHYMHQLLSALAKNNKIKIGRNETIMNGLQIICFEEKNMPISCEQPDRYNLCSFMVDEKDERLFKTRYHDFPW